MRDFLVVLFAFIAMFVLAEVFAYYSTLYILRRRAKQQVDDCSGWDDYREDW